MTLLNLMLATIFSVISATPDKVFLKMDLHALDASRAKYERTMVDSWLKQRSEWNKRCGNLRGLPKHEKCIETQKKDHEECMNNS